MKKSQSSSPAEKKQLIILSDFNELKKVEDFSQEIAGRSGLNEEQSDNLAIVLTELTNNAILHGNRQAREKKVIIEAVVYPDRLVVSVTDEGKGFDPARLQNPTDPENIWKENGRGIFLVRNLIDEVEFRPTPRGTTIVVTEYLKKKP